MVREPEVGFVLSAISNDTTRGEVGVSYNGSWYYSSTVPYPANCSDSSSVIKAFPSGDYHFGRWSSGSIANPDTMYLTGDSTVTAYFYSFNVNTGNSERGTVSHTKIIDRMEKITAAPASGYHFGHWSTGSTNKLDTVYLNGDSLVTAFFYSLGVASENNVHGNVWHVKICERVEKIMANANNGYHFDHWSNGSIANPDTLYLMGDSMVTAFFAPNTFTLTLLCNDPDFGSVNGGGEYSYLDTVTITATAVEHYHFVRWSDGNTGNPRQYVITEDDTLTAYFAIDTHIVSVNSSNIVRGSVSGGGEFVYGTPCTIEATAYSGYTFVSWSNGATYNPYTFAVLEDVELTAIFLAPDEITYTVTVESDDPTMGTATVNGNSTATVISGSSVTISAAAFDGYRFVRWNDNDTHAVRTVTVTADATYTAYFESMTQGIVDVNEREIKVYTADGRIYVRVDGESVEEFHVYDAIGREVFHATHADETSALPGGVYLVKVDTLPARKVVVIR